MRLCRTFAALAVLVGVLVVNVSGASASDRYFRFIPEGINPDNPGLAWQQVSNRAQVDPSYAGTIAREAGVKTFKSSDFQPLGYQAHAPKGTTNSASTSTGKSVAVRDHNGSQNVKVLVVVNIHTSKRVYLMVRCGNTRIHTSHPLPWKPFASTAVVRFHKTVNKSTTITCPSGQKVAGKVKVTVVGTARGRSWGKTQGNLSLYTMVKVDEQARVALSLKCGPAPKPAPATPSAPCVLGPGQIHDSAGNCVSQSNNAEQNCKAAGGSYNTVTVTCTIVQINANCSNVTIIDGNGNVITQTQQGNCTITVNPPPVTPPTTPPVIDVCLNIPGTQTTIPQGSKPDGNGNCIKDNSTTPPAPPTAPGPNPNPSPGSPSVQCYYSDTGLPAPTPADPLHPPANVVC